ncbi:MAG: hypothetical protein LBT04_01290 [Prevotellaceae bacterium]|nr:hypothetical protein [Prevotellaceae bacterium]
MKNQNIKKVNIAASSEDNSFEDVASFIKLCGNIIVCQVNYAMVIACYETCKLIVEKEQQSAKRNILNLKKYNL